MGLNMDEQKAVERFRQQVVDPSQDKLVIVDFWAEWCGPCKALTPVLEKVAAEYADKGVVLAKINVDEERFIADQFQVQSIPTVYAIFQGQPVADLSPARSESQLKGALDQILAQLPIGAGAAGAAPQVVTPDQPQPQTEGQPQGQPHGMAPGQLGGQGQPQGEVQGQPQGQAQGQPGQQQAPDINQLVGMAEQMLAEGDTERAASVFMQIAQIAPDNANVASGLIRSLVAAGRIEEATAAYDTMPQAMKDDPLVQQAQSALELSGTSVDDGELQALRAAAAERPADMEAQMAFAEAAFAARQRDEAAATLLHMFEADPEWNEGAAKAKLLQIFEAVGLQDPWVADQRRKLSLLLFG